MPLLRPFDLIAAFAFLLALNSASGEKIDLSGSWEFHLPDDPGVEISEPESLPFRDRIELPGMITAQGFGEEPSLETEWTGGGWTYPEMFTEFQSPENFKFPFFLQPPRYHVGPAFFRREINVPEDAAKRPAMLLLERAHWHTTVWIDGREMARDEALGTPQELELGLLAPGKHSLILRVDNRLAPVNPGSSAHSVTDHTQGNWNGVVGEISLRFAPASRLASIRIDAGMNPEFSIRAEGIAAGKASLLFRVASKSEPERILARTTMAVNETGAFQKETKLRLPGEPELWNEFNPHLYQLTAILESEDKETDTRIETFGFRKVESRDGKLLLNGHPLFLRGALDCAIFPRTGHPPTDLASWQKVMATCRDYGLNHLRFHSWCPPEAAFMAADEAGIYLQPEASTWSHNDSNLGSGLPLDEWSQRETARMMRCYGNHPSFLMMAHGNEPHGPNHAQWLQDWVARWQKEDPRRLYTTGSGWTVRPGSDFHSIPNPRLHQWGEGLRSRLNAMPPSTDFDFSQFVERYPGTPVVAHESGQWCAFPDFDLIGKFDGFFRAKNYEIFRSLAEEHGLLENADRYLRDSGKWQAACYKHDIEAALRTPGLGGFQLLGLQDFPGQGTAPVGVVDVFWEPKPYFTAEEYRRFCGPIVPLARLPKMVFTNDETLTARLQLSHFGSTALKSCSPRWELVAGDSVVGEGHLPERDFEAGTLYDLGSIGVPLRTFREPARATLTVHAGDGVHSNQWEIFIYPAKLANQREPLVTGDWAKAKDALESGEDVLFLPSPDRIGDDPVHPLLQSFSPVFWNTAYTTWQPPHTLGLSLDPAHPVFSEFPTGTHSNWQWWELQQNARPFILTNHPDIQPLVEIIDDWFTARKLGFVFEARMGKGRLVACGMDLANKLESRPAARQFRHSLVRYMTGGDFEPTTSLSPEEMEALLTQPSLAQRLGMTATASSAEPGYLAEACLDGNPRTLWHTEFTARKPGPPHRLELAFRQPTNLAGLLLTQRQDGNRNGQARDIIIRDGKGSVLLETRVPPDVQSHRVAFPSASLSSRITLEIRSSHSGPFASLAEVSPILSEREASSQ